VRSDTKLVVFSLALLAIFSVVPGVSSNTHAASIRQQIVTRLIGT
jgi:hypothetical protein